MPTRVVDRPDSVAPPLDLPDVVEPVEVPAAFAEAFRVSAAPARVSTAPVRGRAAPARPVGIWGTISAWVRARSIGSLWVTWTGLLVLALVTTFVPSLGGVDPGRWFAPSSFKPFQGASAEPIRFVYGRGTVAAVPGGLLLDWQEGREPAVRMQFGNLASEPEVERQVDGADGAASIRYREAWPGIDAVVRTTPTGLAYDFIVAPGVDPATIELTYLGATELLVEPDGRLRVKAATSGWREGMPESWQDGPGGREGVYSAFDLRGSDRFGFTVGPYDPSRPLVVDPPMEPLD